MGGISQLYRFSARNEGSEPHIEPPSPGFLHQEDEPLKCLALKTSRAYVQESGKAIGNRDFTVIKGSCRISYNPNQSPESVV